MVKISVCSMMQDEEANIHFWYRKAKVFADEILIGSVGSRPTDAYSDIRYIDYHKDTPVAKGFCYVKNDLINHATGDWIVMLDADEAMCCSSEALRAILDNTDAIGFKTHTHIPVGGACQDIEELATRESEYSGESHCRIFRKLPGMHYIGIIHEEVYYNGYPLSHQCGFLKTIGMMHYGARIEKARRNTIYSELLLRNRDIPSLRCWNGDQWAKRTESCYDYHRKYQAEFWRSRGGKMHPEIADNPAGTHWHVLENAIRTFNCKRILELGVGYTSTNQLHAMGLEVHSYETNPEAAAKFPSAKTVSSYDEVPDLDYDLVFVDNAPADRRNIDINRFRNAICVVHDTEDAAYNYRNSVGTMKYCYTDMTYRPWTSVCSDAIDVNSLRLGAGFAMYVPVDWRY